jgi:hypothetical protein
LPISRRRAGPVARAIRSAQWSVWRSPRAFTRSPTWTRTVALVREHVGLLAALGSEECPSVYACYRSTAKLREHKQLLDACIDGVLARLREQNPGMGENIAIDGSDMPAYANGQRYVSKGGRERAPEEYSDPDAS